MQFFETLIVKGLDEVAQGLILKILKLSKI